MANEAGSGASGDGTPGANGAPPAAGPPPAAPPPPPARAAAGKDKNKGKGGKHAPFDQHPGFRKRVDQEAARILRRELGGISLEEAKAIIAARGGTPAPAAAAPAAGTPPAGPSAPVPVGETARERRLREENEQLKQRVTRQHQKILKQRDGKRADVTTLEMKFEAVQAGIAEKYTRFALDEYRELWLQFQAKPASVAPEIKKAFESDPIDGRAIFGHIRAQNPMIAAGAAQPPVVVPLAPSTSPPASRQPGEETPTPNPPASGGDKPFDASKLNDKDWREFKRSQGMNF